MSGNKKCNSALVFMGLIAATLNVNAGDIKWTGSGEGLWTDSGNWTAALSEGDRPVLDRSDISATIPEGTTGTFNQLLIAPGHSTNVVLKMEGGHLVVKNGADMQTLRIGFSSGSDGCLQMSGGLIEIGDFEKNEGNLQIGCNGNGALIMTGGEIRVAGPVQVPAASLGVGTIRMSGDAVLWMGEQFLRGSDGYTKIEIGDKAKIIFKGNKRQHVSNWISGGYIKTINSGEKLESKYSSEDKETTLSVKGQ